MEFRKFGNQYVIRMDKGEEVLTNLTKFCTEQNIKLAHLTALGATNRVKIGLFHTDVKKYESKELTGDMEITSLVGNVTTQDEKTYLHLHINVADENQNVYGGHLNECYISATCEMFLTAIDGTVDRKFDEEIGLNLFQF